MLLKGAVTSFQATWPRSIKLRNIIGRFNSGGNSAMASDIHVYYIVQSRITYIVLLS